MFHFQPSNVTCRADPNFTNDPKLKTPVEKAFSAASSNYFFNLKTLNVFLDFVDLSAEQKLEYIGTVFNGAQKEDFEFVECVYKNLDLGRFKKQLSSLPVAMVGAF